MSAFPSWLKIETSGESNWDDDDIQEQIQSYKFYNGKHTLYFEAGPHIYYRFDAEGNRVNVAGATTVLGVVNKPHLKAWAAKLAIEFVKQSMLLPDGSFKPYSTEEFMAMLHEAKGQHTVHLNKAGDIGHIAHGILEDSIKYAIKNTGGVLHELKGLPTEDTPANKMAIICANHALAWAQRHNVIWLETERLVYSEELDAAGTMDGLCIVDSCDDLECCRGRVFKGRKTIADFKSSNQLDESYAYQVCFYLFAYIEEFGEYVPDRVVLRLGKTEGDFESWFIDSSYFEADLEAFISALILYRSLKDVTQRRQEDGRELRAIINDRKRVAREAREAQEKADRFAAKLLRMAETKRRNEAKEARYRDLRAEGMSVVDAKAQVLIDFPKPTKAESDEDDADDQVAEIVQSVQPIEQLPDGVEYIVRL